MTLGCHIHFTIADLTIISHIRCLCCDFRDGLIPIRVLSLNQSNELVLPVLWRPSSSSWPGQPTAFPAPRNSDKALSERLACELLQLLGPLALSPRHQSSRLFPYRTRHDLYTPLLTGCVSTPSDLHGRLFINGPFRFFLFCFIYIPHQICIKGSLALISESFP
jgi:hypothetical protein